MTSVFFRLRRVVFRNRFDTVLAVGDFGDTPLLGEHGNTFLGFAGGKFAAQL